MSEAHHHVTALLANHPRLTGAAFTAMVLLSQVGSVLAERATDVAGP